MYIYWVYVLSYIATSSYCFCKDYLFNTNKEESKISLDKYKKALPLVTFNVIIVGYGGVYLFYKLYDEQPFHILLSPLKFMISIFMANVLFYGIHRVFHNFSAISKYHRVHHEFKEPIGLRAAYTHPIDYFFGNMVPLGLTPFLIGVDTFTFTIITFFSIHKTVIEEHSNYNTSRHHLDHHKYYNCNYGASWLDKFFNTMRKSTTKEIQ